MTRSRSGNLIIILILGALSTVSPFSIDMYLPAFPQIAHDLGTTQPEISFSVSGYFIGMALGQLFYGPLLDRFGRKRPLYAGLGLFVLASIGCMTARSPDIFIAFRLLQAFGGCAAGVGAVAMVRDFFPAEESRKNIVAPDPGAERVAVLRPDDRWLCHDHNRLAVDLRHSCLLCAAHDGAAAVRPSRRPQARPRHIAAARRDRSANSCISSRCRNSILMRSAALSPSPDCSFT